MPRVSYQNGCVFRRQHATGPDTWSFRWREPGPDGTSVQRSQTIGTVDQYPNKADAQRAVESLRLEINASPEVVKIPPMTVADAWGHFQANELRDPEIDRSPTTILNYLTCFKAQILPRWASTKLIDVKALAVEKWLRGLDMAPGSKAKLKGLLSALFRHCIRHELYDKQNPIQTVRQGAKRQKDPDVLTMDEMKSLLIHIILLAAQVMVSVVAASGLRRSEMLGLKWEDLDLEKCWFHCKRGLVGMNQTKMKTIASRKSCEMNPALAEILIAWREKTPYPEDSDWVFASPHTNGERPYWPDSILKNHVRKAAKLVGIKKMIGWHTFRHSLGTFMGNEGENIKTVQELLRHASPKITAELYQQGDTATKRSALDRMSGIFVVQAKAS